MQSHSTPDVSGLSLRARLAVALYLFRGYCDRKRLDHPEIDRFADHLWEFIGMPGDSDAFGRWTEREPVLTHAALGDPFPSDFTDFLSGAAVQVDEFRRVIGNCVEVIYSSMYGAASDESSRQFLYEMAGIGTPLGVTWPDLRQYKGSRWEDGHGWGSRPLAEEIAVWRTYPSR